MPLDFTKPFKDAKELSRKSGDAIEDATSVKMKQTPQPSKPAVKPGSFAANVVSAAKAVNKATKAGSNIAAVAKRTMPGAAAGGAAKKAKRNYTK